MTHEELKEKRDRAIAMQHWWNAAMYDALRSKSLLEDISIEAAARGMIDVSPQWIYDTLSDMLGDEALEGFEP